jgi:hypothetical protein
VVAGTAGTVAVVGVGRSDTAVAAETAQERDPVDVVVPMSKSVAALGTRLVSLDMYLPVTSGTKFAALARPVVISVVMRDRLRANGLQGWI